MAFWMSRFCSGLPSVFWRQITRTKEPVGVRGKRTLRDSRRKIHPGRPTSTPAPNLTLSPLLDGVPVLGAPEGDLTITRADPHIDFLSRGRLVLAAASAVA